MNRGVKFVFEREIHPDDAADHLNGQISRNSSPLVSINNLCIKKNPINLALVQSFFGQDKSHVESCTLAIKLMSLSNPMPREWVFVEAQKSEADAKFKWVVKYGIKYIFVRIQNNRQDYFIKEQLWNIGAANTKSPNLVFLDADVAYCQTNWIELVYQMFWDKCELFQPHAWSWRANEDFMDKNANSANLMESFAHRRSLDIPIGTFGGHTGYDIAISRKLYDKIRGFHSLRGAGGDFLMWSLLCKRSGSMDGFIEYHPLKELILKKFPQELGVDIGCTGLICFHNAHGKYADRSKGYVQSNDMPVVTNNYGKDKIEEMPE